MTAKPMRPYVRVKLGPGGTGTVHIRALGDGPDVDISHAVTRVEITGDPRKGTECRLTIPVVDVDADIHQAVLEGETVDES